MSKDANNLEPRRARARVWGWLRGALVMLLAPAGCAWMLGRWSYYIDVIAVYQLQISLLIGLIAMALLVCRCWRSGLPLILISTLGLWSVVRGRALTLPEVDFSRNPRNVIRVVSCNINPKNPDWRAGFDQLLDLDADILVLIESPWQLSRSVMKEGHLEKTPYRTYAHRNWVDKETSPCFVISKWDMARLDVGPEPMMRQQVLHARIDHPAGEIVVGPLHPLSPRDEARWDAGNRAIDLQAHGAEQRLAGSELPLLLCGDLNAGPAQLRARTIRGAGMSMSKPVLRSAGSFPEGGDVPGLVMLQLDDCWHSDGVRPVAWSMLPVIGSDHRAVVVDFVIQAKRPEPSSRASSP